MANRNPERGIALPTWEYHRERLQPGKLKDEDAKLNELGRKGWELVSVVPIVQAGSATNVHAFFKRTLEREGLDS